MATSRKQFAPLEIKWIRGYIEQLLEAGIIESINTSGVGDSRVIIQQTSHVTLAPQPTPKKYRFCVNYMYLNSQLQKGVWEIRNLEECIRKLSGYYHISGIDSFSGFMTIPLGAHRELSAFVVTGCGVFIWRMLPFGLQGGPGTYSLLMWIIFREEIGDNFQIYLDNVDFADGKRLPSTNMKELTDSQAIDAQLDQLEFKVFPGFVKANISVNPAKSALLAKTKETLGHVVFRYGTTKAPETVSKFKSILR